MASTVSEQEEQGIELKTRGPGVVFLVPAMIPLYPFASAMSLNLRDLQTQHIMR